MDEVVEGALADARALCGGGASAMLFENFGDVPFSKTAGPETIAAMSFVVAEVVREVNLPFGVNVLRNDPIAALGIAAATGALFVRVNVHTGSMVTDQGVIEGMAAETLRKRRELGIEHVAIFADHLVKHASPLAPVDLVQSAKDLRFRGLADAILVTGAATGAPANPGKLATLRLALPEAPLVVASGVSEENAARWRDIVDGVIVGTSLKFGGEVSEPVDPARVARLVSAFRG